MQRRPENEIEVGLAHGRGRRRLAVAATPEVTANSAKVPSVQAAREIVRQRALRDGVLGNTIQVGWSVS